MCSDKVTISKFKRVCTDLPNIAILAKRFIPSKIKMNLGQAAIGNKSPEETGASFALTGSTESPMVVSLNSGFYFSCAGENIYLPIMELII